MNNLRIYKNADEMLKYFDSIKLRELGSGSEGSAYLTRDNQVLKVIENPLLIREYNKDIITSDKINLETFLFPNELVIYNGLIIGYKTNYFPNDIFYNNSMEMPEIMDLNKLLKARNKMIKDIELLSSMNYRLLDLPLNIMFDGNNLVACDTLSYHKDDSKDLLKDNISSLDYALNIKLCEIDSAYDYIFNKYENTEEAVKELIKEKCDTTMIVFPRF